MSVLLAGGWDNLLAVIPGGSSTPLIPKRYDMVVVTYTPVLKTLFNFDSSVSLIFRPVVNFLLHG